MRTLPIWPAWAERARSLPRWNSFSILWHSLEKILPAGVRVTLWVVRCSRVSCSSCSSEEIARLSAGWVINMALAVWVKFKESARAQKHSN